MLHRLVAIVVALFMAGTLAACGDDTAESSGETPNAETPSETTTDDQSDDSGEAGDEGGSQGDNVGTTGDAGTATVDGTSYEFDRALRCDVDSMGVEGVSSEIEAQFLGSAGGDRVQLDILISEFAGMPMHSVSWAGPEGIFGGTFTEAGGSWMGEGDDVYQDAPVSINGDRATGSVVLYDAFEMVDTIEVDFDVVIPADTFACR